MVCGEGMLRSSQGDWGRVEHGETGRRVSCGMLIMQEGCCLLEMMSLDSNTRFCCVGGVDCCQAISGFALLSLNAGNR